jgi:hypothetical protein
MVVRALCIRCKRRLCGSSWAAFCSDEISKDGGERATARTVDRGGGRIQRKTNEETIRSIGRCRSAGLQRHRFGPDHPYTPRLRHHGSAGSNPRPEGWHDKRSGTGRHDWNDWHADQPESAIRHRRGRIAIRNATCDWERRPRDLSDPRRNNSLVRRAVRRGREELRLLFLFFWLIHIHQPAAPVRQR